MAEVRLEQVDKRFGDITAVTGIDLTIPTASSWCCSARPAPARPRPCA